MVGETSMITSTLKYSNGTSKKVAMSAAKAKALASVKWSKVPKPDLSKIKNQKLLNITSDNYRSGSKI
jgi:hypothetical protein